MRLWTSVIIGFLALGNSALSQSNDNFAGRTVLSGSTVSAISDNSAATKEAGEPAHAGLAGGRSLWWTWTAPASGLVNFSVFGSAGTTATSIGYFPSTALAVYTGSSVGALSEAGSSNNQQELYLPSTVGTIATGPSFNLQVAAGTTYQIAFDSTSPTSPVALNINQPPTLVSSITAAAYTGGAFSYSIQASNSPASYGATGLPAGLSVNSFTGVISGTPSAIGTYSVTISATNPAGTGTAILTLTVSNAASTPSPPAIYGAAATSTIVGDSFSYFINGDSSATSYAVSGLPPGLNYNVSTGEIAGSPTAAGTYAVSISATNAVGTTNATLTIVVASLTQIPVIVSSAVATGTVGSSFTYFIDWANSEPTSYSASNLPPGIGFDPTSGFFDGVPTTPGTFVVPITATNSAGTGSAVLTITISPLVAPSGVLITSGAAASGTVGSSFTYIIQAIGSPTAFTATNLPPGLSLNPQSGFITGTPLTVGTYTVPISAANSGTSANATLTVTIAASGTSSTPAQFLPLITSRVEAIGYVGTSLSYQVQFYSGYGGYPPAYAATGLPPGLSINASSGLISGSPTAIGNYQATVSVTVPSIFTGTPAATGSGIVTFQIASSPPAPTVAPVITSPANVSGAVGTAFTYSVSASGNPTGYSASGLPAGLSINASSGAITGTPTTAGSYNVSLSASNTIGTGGASVGMTIASQPSPPAFSSNCQLTGTVGTSLYYYIDASNSPTAYAASNLPPGLGINTSNGEVSGTPTAAGTFSVPISATNAGGTTTVTLTIVITSQGVPVISSNAGASGSVGSSFGYSITASNSPTSYSATNLPSGLSLDTSGYIYGTPTVLGTFNVPISATNAVGTGNAMLNITILPAVPLVITSAPYAGATVGSSFLYTITTGSTAYSYNATNLPPGLSIDTVDGYIYGTPTTSGTYSVPITASNGSVSGQASLTINVSPAQAITPVITSSAAGGGIQGAAFSYTIAAGNSPTSFSASSLPAGLTINTATGVISGTPSVSGTFSVPISATNSAGTGNATLMIAIASMPTAAPVITSSAGADCYSGEPFYYFITASNAPTSFSATNLPSGLTLNSSTGLISGSTAAQGTISITIGATNAVGTGTATLALSVPYNGVAPPRITSAAAAAPVKGSSFSYKVTVTASPFSYSASNLPPGLSFNSSTGTISGTPTTTGTYATNVSASTSWGTATGVVTFVVGTAATTLPVMTSSDGFNGYVGESFYYPITVSNSPTNFAASGLPAGLAINSSTGIISGTPTSSGTSTATLTLTNATGSSTAKLALQIGFNPPSSHFSSSAAVSGFVGSPLSSQLTTYPSSSFYYADSSLPPGLSLNSSTGLISGTPTTAGVFPFTVFTNAYESPTATITFVIAATAPSVSTITSPAAAIGYIGANLTYTVTATNLPTSFGASNLPAGLTIDPNSGTISGRPQTSGIFTIPISATNSIGTSNATLTLNISSIPPPPVITSAAMVSVAAGTQAVFYSVTATNSPTSYAASGLPPGLSIDTTTGGISGLAGGSGSYSVTISATNAGGTASALVPFIVTGGAAPVVSSTAADTAFAGVTYDYYLSGSNNPTSFAATGLPSGLSINSVTGVISGAPSAAGTFTIGVSATNSAGTGNGTLTLAVSSSLPAATIYSGELAASGVVGQAFSYSFYADNPGVDQVRNSYAASGLPPGLSLDQTNGQISGTPTTAGTYVVAISASNSAATTSASVTMTIVPNSAPVITSAVGAVGFVGSTFSYAISAGGALQYSATNLPPGLALNPALGVISGYPTTAGDYTASLSASNASGTGTANVRFLILSAANSPPVITSPAAVGFASSSQFYFSFGSYETGSFSYPITASNGATSFSASGLPAGLSLNPFTGTISGVPTVSGTYQVPISASNSAGTANATLTIILATTPATITASADVAGFVGSPLSYQINTNQVLFNPTSPGTGTISYVAAGLPPGLSLNTATGVITGTPTAAGTFPVTVSATDPAATNTAVVTFLISGTAPSASGPVISYLDAAASGAVGVSFNYAIWAANLPTNFSASGLPPGLTLFVQSGTDNGIPTQYATISGTPSGTGTFVVPVTASNAQGSASAQITLVIAPAPASPVISSAAEVNGTVGSSFTYFIFTAYDSTTSNAAKTYSAVSLPPGLTINSTTGLISGTPTTAGTFVVPIAATVAGVAGNATVTMVIAPQTAPDGVPAITGQAGAVAFVGLPFSYSVMAANATAITTGPLPAGLSLVVSAGASNGAPAEFATISGTPASSGTFTIPVTGTNAVGSATGQLTISVIMPQAALPWIIAQPVNQTAPEGTNIVLSVVATGVPAPNFQWLKDGVVVPTGTAASLTINGAQTSDSGNYSVMVSNSSGGLTSQSAVVTVTTTYGSWQTAHFTADEIAAGLAAANSNFNGDGVTNLMDYALGRDPKTGAGGALPMITIPNGVDHLQIVFQRDTRNADINYIVEASSDLATWTAIASSIDGAPTSNLGGANAITESTGIVRTVTVCDAASVTGGGQRYLRLKVAGP